MRKTVSSILFLVLICSGAYSQILGPLFKSNWIPVKDGINNSSIPNAWSGGINACLFNTLSLNGDAIDDLFIYDRTSERPMMYLGVELNGEIVYEYAPEFETILPEIQNWVLMRDYNCDGKKDIFTSRPGGIRVFKDISQGSTPEYELEEEILLSVYDFGSPIETNIFVSSIDIPAIADHDGDGDLDILTFALSVGGVIEFHKNLSMENFGTCDSLAFELRNQCYGAVQENSASPAIALGFDCPFNVANPKILSEDKHGQHAGSTICTFDYDQNGYQDLLIGDITADSLTLLLNGPSQAGADSIFQLETSFPQSNIPVMNHTFLSSFYEDFDQDGINDLIVTINKEEGIEDDQNVLYYRNTGLNDLPNFQFTQNDLLVDNMIDLGTNSFPHFFDYNADGLMDLIVTNRGFYQNTSSVYEAKVFLFENTGSSDLPEFTLIDDDYAGISNLGLGEALFPTFGDLDNDGDQDMIIGSKTGEHHYFENTASPGSPANFIPTILGMETSDGEDLDPGQWATPQLYDIDFDGDLDLIVGERNSNINFYENIGNPNAFSFELVNDTLGNIFVDSNGDTVGHSVPFIFNNGGETEMLIGNDEGFIFHVNDLENNLNGSFNIIDSSFYDLRPGSFTSLAMYDLNNDGMLDMLTGNESGGLNFYGSFMVGLEEENILVDNGINIFPNPNEGLFSVVSENGIIKELNVYTIQGQLIYSAFSSSPQLSIDISNYSSGLYIVNGKSSKGLFTERIILK